MLNKKSPAFAWKGARTLFAFLMLRVFEFVALVGTAALLEKLHQVAINVTNASPFFLPLIAALGFYIGFGYIVVSAAAFGVAFSRSRKRPVSLMVANVMPLAIWGGAALLVIYGSRVPITFITALIAGVFVNASAAYVVQGTSWFRGS